MKTPSREQGEESVQLPQLRLLYVGSVVLTEQSTCKKEQKGTIDVRLGTF